MLDSLIIKNFRCLEDFSVEKLGRVNLIVGKNNSGKSTVLEALRLYAGNAQRPLLETIAIERDERTRIGETEQGDYEAALPYQDFFTGRLFPADESRCIQIGSLEIPDARLTIEHIFASEVLENIENGPTNEAFMRTRYQVVSKEDAEKSADDLIHALKISKGSRLFPLILLDRPISRARMAMVEGNGSVPFSMVGTQISSPDELADVWDKIVFTKHQDVVKQAMQIIAPEFENLTFVRSDVPRGSLARAGMQRGAKVKLSNELRPVPLNSLGDGMMRVLQLALKIFPAKGGFLLIDEFENGLHYSVQQRVWELLFEMALRLDIQVFATTHSWDCIESFSKVANDRKDIDGMLFRMGRSVRNSDRGRVIATVFDEAALFNITQADAEVR